VRASARVEVAWRDGRDVVVDMRSEPPLAVRVAGDRVLVVGSAAAPVGGDELAFEIVVGAGARLALGTVAATMAWPSPRGDASAQRVDVTVGADGHLAWVPEPLVLVAGCHHETTTQVSLAAGATVWIVEEISLGRTGQESGSLTMSWRVERDGRPLVHHAERLGPDAPGWGSAVTTGPHRHVLAAIAVGPACPVIAPIVATDAAVAVLRVADDAWVVLATGVDRVALHRALPSGVVSRPGPRAIERVSGQGDLVEREIGGAVGEGVVEPGRDGHGVGDGQPPDVVTDPERRGAGLDEPQHQLGVVAVHR
jgi:urease accessory protein